MEEKLRYSDEELEEFRKIIQDKLQVEDMTTMFCLTS